MMKMTILEYSKHRKITERSVRRYVAAGALDDAIIHQGKNRIFIDQEQADSILKQHAMTRKELLPKPQKQAEVAQQAGTSGLSFQEARTLAQRYKAALLKIELDEKTGRLVDGEQIKAAAFNKARQVRDSLLNIPDRIGPILAAETDQGKVARILTTEIKQSLEELSR